MGCVCVCGYIYVLPVYNCIHRRLTLLHCCVRLTCVCVVVRFWVHRQDGEILRTCVDLMCICIADTKEYIILITYTLCIWCCFRAICELFSIKSDFSLQCECESLFATTFRINTMWRYGFLRQRRILCLLVYICVLVLSARSFDLHTNWWAGSRSLAIYRSFAACNHIARR